MLRRSLSTVALLTSLAGCDDLKSIFKEPEPVGVIAFLDSSASFAPRRQEALGVVRALNGKLLGKIDWMLAFRVSDDVYWLHDAEKAGSKKLLEALEQYVQVAPGARGTAYGEVLERAGKEARELASKVTRSAVVVLGDGKDERSSNGSNIDWETLPTQFKDFPASSHLFFLFIEPKEGNRLRDALKPTLGDRLHFFLPEESASNTATHKILQVLQR